MNPSEPSSSHNSEQSPSAQWVDQILALASLFSILWENKSKLNKLEADGGVCQVASVVSHALWLYGL